MKYLVHLNWRSFKTIPTPNFIESLITVKGQYDFVDVFFIIVS